MEEDRLRISPTASNTTYHSFNDIELQEPLSPPRTRDSTRTHERDSGLNREGAEQELTAVKMQRKDSGYGSNTGSPRNSSSRSRPPTSPARRGSNPNSQTKSPSSPPLRPRTRPSTRRAAKSYPQPSTAQPLFQARPTAAAAAGTSGKQVAYFHFPTPDLVELTEAGIASSSSISSSSPASSTHHRVVEHRPHEHEMDRATSSGPLQTTHYWTSDSTRRLEYAAIDAASRGFTGWVRRHLVPDCFGPRQHVAFDDDTGSVRRYRLELEDEQHDHHHCASGAEKTAHGGRRRRPWSLWPLRKRNTF
ncbi:inorganic phosphate transporter [Purpureocillium lavendulum]|uniref:Inorganic phosphate transporter n=1 Tax=Purpureocillium lavendulum TaxID=1247861 RepID=A0AB34FK85_9HYPO|nr:inorganic phosphate transporter [Purpureocillium lavendulum]